MKHTFHVAAILAVLLVSGCTPLQTVRPLPDFVILAIEPGDRIELVTTAGDRLKFKVDHVDRHSIGSPDRRIVLEEIDELYVRSKKRPAYPCGDGLALGCSVPGKVKGADFLIVKAASAVGGAVRSVVNALGGNWHTKFERRFYEACVQHDFCYRHGYQTYGHDKEYCDDEFYRNMVDSCGQADIACVAAAKEFHWAVREHAEEGAYRTSASTYCSYDGPVNAN